MLMPRPMPREPPVTTATLPLSLSSAMFASLDSLLADHGLPLGTELVDLDVDDIPVGQVGEATREGHSFRRSGVDDVAGVEHHVLTQIPHQVQHRENHVGCR